MHGAAPKTKNYLAHCVSSAEAEILTSLVQDGASGIGCFKSFPGSHVQPKLKTIALDPCSLEGETI